jgi:hypothetical protein
MSVQVSIHQMQTQVQTPSCNTWYGCSGYAVPPRTSSDLLGTVVTGTNMANQSLVVLMVTCPPHTPAPLFLSPPSSNTLYTNRWPQQAACSAGCRWCPWICGR